MYNYLRELHRVFCESITCEPLRTEIKELHQSLRQQLSGEERKQLLALIDKEAALADALSLSSFIAGFRLAGGISAELCQSPAFSFGQAEEQRACAVFESKWQQH